MEQPATVKPTYRRRQYYINKDFQKRIIIYLTVLIVVTILVAHGLAIGYTKLLQISQPVALQQPTALNWAQGIDLLWLPILITMLLGIVFALIFGLLYSHRIAGPLFNLKRMLHKVESGDLSSTMHIRSYDEFHDVEQSFNQMLQGLNQRLNRLQTAVSELPTTEKRKMQKYLEEWFLASPENLPKT